MWAVAEWKETIGVEARRGNCNARYLSFQLQPYPICKASFFMLDRYRHSRHWHVDGEKESKLVLSYCSHRRMDVFFRHNCILWH